MFKELGKSEVSDIRPGLWRVRFVTVFAVTWITIGMVQGLTSFSLKGKETKTFLVKANPISHKLFVCWDPIYCARVILRPTFNVTSSCLILRNRLQNLYTPVLKPSCVYVSIFVYMSVCVFPRKRSEGWHIHLPFLDGLVSRSRSSATVSIYHNSVYVVII